MLGSHAASNDSGVLKKQKHALQGCVSCRLCVLLKLLALSTLLQVQTRSCKSISMTQHTARYMVTIRLRN